MSNLLATLGFDSHGYRSDVHRNEVWHLGAVSEWNHSFHCEGLHQEGLASGFLCLSDHWMQLEAVLAESFGRSELEEQIPELALAAPWEVGQIQAVPY